MEKGVAEGIKVVVAVTSRAGVDVGTIGVEVAKFTVEVCWVGVVGIVSSTG